MVKLTALILLLLLGGVPKPAPITLTVILSRQTGFAPLDVVAEGLIRDPSHLLLCPSYFFFWGDGSKSVDTTLTCEALPQADRPSLRRTNPQHHHYSSLGYAGEIVIVVIDSANPTRRALGRHYVEFHSRFAQERHPFAMVAAASWPTSTP